MEIISLLQEMRRVREEEQWLWEGEVAEEQEHIWMQWEQQLSLQLKKMENVENE